MFCCDLHPEAKYFCTSHYLKNMKVSWLLVFIKACSFFSISSYFKYPESRQSHNAIVRCVCVVWDIGKEWNFPYLVDLSQPADKSLKVLTFCLIFFQYCKIISYLQSNEFQQENSLWDWVLSRSVKQQADSAWRIKMMMGLNQQSPCLKVMAEFYMITSCNI